MWRLVTGALSAAAQPDLRVRHGRINIEALPVEILAHCFEYLHDHLLARLVVLHVSRTWRATAFAFPSTWSVIRLSDGEAHGHLLVDMVLSKTSAYPVDFIFEHDIRIRYVSTEDMARVVEKHLPRFRSITWNTTPASALRLCTEAPLLECFHTPALFPRMPAPQLLGGLPSRLRSLQLPYLILPAICPALATVRHLKSTISPEWDKDFLHLLFDFFPVLESLDFGVFLQDATNLPRRPAPRTLRRLRLDAVGNDNDFMDDPRVDLSALCATWQVLPQVQSLELVTFAVSEAHFALILDGAVALSVMVGRASTAISASQACGAQRTLHLRHRRPPALDALQSHVARIVPRIAGVRILTLPPDFFHLFARTSTTAKLNAVSSLKIIVYPNARYMREPSGSFPWAHLDVFPPLPYLEHLDVDVQHRSAVDPYVFARPDAADAQALLARLDAGLSSRSGARVDVTIRGFPEDVANGITIPSSDAYSISLSRPAPVSPVFY